MTTVNIETAGVLEPIESDSVIDKTSQQSIDHDEHDHDELQRQQSEPIPTESK